MENCEVLLFHYESAAEVVEVVGIGWGFGQVMYLGPSMVEHDVS